MRQSGTGQGRAQRGASDSDGERNRLVCSERQAFEELQHSLTNMGFSLSLFLMWTIFKSLSGIPYRFASAFSLAFFLAARLWDLGSLTRDRTHIPCIGWQCLNHWTARDFFLGRWKSGLSIQK